jgi:hypothetical protein
MTDRSSVSISDIARSAVLEQIEQPSPAVRFRLGSPAFARDRDPASLASQPHKRHTIGRRRAAEGAEAPLNSGAKAARLTTLSSALSDGCKYLKSGAVVAVRCKGQDASTSNSSSASEWSATRLAVHEGSEREIRMIPLTWSRDLNAPFGHRLRAVERLLAHKRLEVPTVEPITLVHHRLSGIKRTR